MITLYRVHYEIHDEVRKNDKIRNSFIKIIYFKIVFQVINVITK